MTFQEQQRAERTERSAEEEGDRGGAVDQEERTKRTENLHTQDKARERDATKAKEEAVKNVAESMHECDQHERVLRSEQQRLTVTVPMIIEIKDETIEYKSSSLLVWDVGDLDRIRPPRCTI